MSLNAGQQTVPADFLLHSCHCYFLLAGSAELPILFHVELVRDGRSFATRTVQAKQKGKNIFTVTMSFVKDGSGGKEENAVRHACPMPIDPKTGEPVKPPGEEGMGDDESLELINNGPWQTYYISVLNKESPHAHAKKTRQWIRAKGKISAEGGHQAHLNALAYVSDSYFIGTISRIHRLWRFPFPPAAIKGLDEPLRTQMRKLNEFEGGGNVEDWEGRPTVGMIVSLDHSIFFHEPKRVRADEWMFTEMESPWSGDGRGVVTQRIFAADGTLLATCFQEGVLRLKEEDKGEAHKREWKI
jgi:acyl-CoA thioesterase 8